MPPLRIVASLAWWPDGRFIAIGDIDDKTLSQGSLRPPPSSSSAAAVADANLRAWMVPL